MSFRVCVTMPCPLKDTRAEAVVQDAEAVRRVLTVRGRTGAVVVMDVVRDETAADVSDYFMEKMHAGARAQVEYIAADNPSPKLHRSMAACCPRFKALYLDPVHVVIVYHTAFWHQWTPGQAVLRRIQAKFSKVDRSLRGDHWGPLYTGAEVVPFGRVEESFRGLVLRGGMAPGRAANVINSMDDEKPWRSIQEYLEAVAAMVAAFPGEMARKTYMQGRSIRSVLWCATATERVQWLFNGIRVRHNMPVSMVALLGSGTAPNESLHHEVNTWYRNQPEVFPVTLSLELRVARLAKLVAHNAALYRPTLRQMGQADVLLVALQGITVAGPSWGAWCAEQLREDRRRAPAALPMSLARKELQRRIAAVAKPKEVRKPVYSVVRRPAGVLKKPAAVISRRTGPVRVKALKRTPFTLKREHLPRV